MWYLAFCRLGLVVTFSYVKLIKDIECMNTVYNDITLFIAVGVSCWLSGHREV